MQKDRVCTRLLKIFSCSRELHEAIVSVLFSYKFSPETYEMMFMIVKLFVVLYLFPWKKGKIQSTANILK